MQVTPSRDLQAAVKPVDSWWTVAVIDPVAVRILPLLLRFRRITPNAVTAAAFLVGGASVVAFARSSWVLGAVLYELRFFLDCLDGKIARVKRLSSPVGAMFDRLADAVTIPTVYATIGFVLARDGHVPERLALLTACGALLVTAVEAVLELARHGQRSSSELSDPPSAAVVAWARRHRLTLRPWTVEAETLGLFLGPLVLRGDALGALELGLAAVYGVFAAIDVALILRIAAQRSAAAET